MTTRIHIGKRLLALVFGATLLGGCAKKMQRYSADSPMWEDMGDFESYGPLPEEYFSAFAWDGADNMLFRPLARVFAIDPAGEALNVNSMDEVPDSSWYENRLSRGPIPVERIVRAACDEPPIDPTGPWTITSAKADGANPGFVIKDQDGRAYLLKFDGVTQPERPTGADVIGSIIYWAAGYHTPCNQTAFFRKEILQIGEGATATKGGVKVPMTWELMEPMLDKAYGVPDGTFRTTASRFLPGRPLGPWRYRSRRADDPNDVVPHQDRRELRGGYVLASWINHFDAREQNTLSMWIETGADKRGYIRHHYIDFGDSFGSMWPIRGMSQRHGHTYYLDMPHLLEDLLTFGAIKRPWRDQELGPTGTVLGYFNVETFEPDEYRTGYQNPAFIRATERDNAWMARIIADFTPEAVAAAVQEAKFVNKLAESELIRILLARREKILKRWFREISPLTQPRVVQATRGSELCLRDLAVSSGISDRTARVYTTFGRQHLRRRHFKDLDVGAPQYRGTDMVCVGLPSIENTSVDSPAYLIVDVTGLNGRKDDLSRPARVHLYQFGEGLYRVVGLQRPYDAGTPSGTDQHTPRSIERL